MAYSTANRPFLTVAAVAGGFIAGSSDTIGQQWMYRSTDVVGTVAASNYFTDGQRLGMRRGDIVTLIVTSGTTPAALHHLLITSVTTAGASPTVIGSSV